MGSRTANIGQSGFSPESFAGRTAVIAGGASGIGNATALQLARQGCTIVILDRDAARAEAASAHIRSAGQLACGIDCDVTDPASIQAALHRMSDLAISADFLVNCVGIVIGEPLVTLSPESWRRSFEVNLDGALFLSQALHGQLAASPVGAIVNVASLAAKGAYPMGGGYGPSKAALVSLTYQMAIEWAHEGIRVNAVNPATTRTPMVANLPPESLEARARSMPLGRLVEPDEVAATICFLLSPGAGAITAQAIDVDCGMSQSLVPAVKR